MAYRSQCNNYNIFCNGFQEFFQEFCIFLLVPGQCAAGVNPFRKGVSVKLHSHEDKLLPAAYPRPESVGLSAVFDKAFAFVQLIGVCVFSYDLKLYLPVACLCGAFDARLRQSAADAQIPVCAVNAYSEFGAVACFPVCTCTAYPGSPHDLAVDQGKYLCFVFAFGKLFQIIAFLFCCESYFIGIGHQKIRLLMCQYEIIKSLLSVFFCAVPQNTFSAVLQRYFLIELQFFHLRFDIISCRLQARYECQSSAGDADLSLSRFFHTRPPPCSFILFSSSSIICIITLAASGSK